MVAEHPMPADNEVDCSTEGGRASPPESASAKASSYGSKPTVCGLDFKSAPPLKRVGNRKIRGVPVGAVLPAAVAKAGAAKAGAPVKSSDKSTSKDALPLPQSKASGPKPVAAKVAAPIRPLSSGGVPPKAQGGSTQSQRTQRTVSGGNGGGMQQGGYFAGSQQQQPYGNQMPNNQHGGVLMPPGGNMMYNNNNYNNMGQTGPGTPQQMQPCFQQMQHNNMGNNYGGGMAPQQHMGNGMNNQGAHMMNQQMHMNNNSMAARMMQQGNGYAQHNNMGGGKQGMPIMPPHGQHGRGGKGGRKGGGNGRGKGNGNMGGGRHPGPSLARGHYVDPNIDGVPISAPTGGGGRNRGMSRKGGKGRKGVNKPPQRGAPY
ncbi:unnamed protein product [Amoebophrya sp. A25]|nr:unnamed protein product [Amoebophrya sp. A25]|eukprot:GSA25T00014674001.1